MLTAGREEPVVSALERMLAMRPFMRAKTVDGVINTEIAERVGLTPEQIDATYQLMAIASYEDRLVIPTSQRELTEDGADMQRAGGFTEGNQCAAAHSGR